VDGGPSDSANRALQMVYKLERAWTRFDVDSEISAVNNNAGNFQLVSRDTYTLVDHAVAAQRATRGRFNPLMLQQLLAHGYASTWTEGTTAPSRFGVAPATCEEIELLSEVRGVRIPPGGSFDPGGIGKGLCADLVTEFLIAEGATTSSVELGGDLRVHGAPWYGPSWRIGVAHPFDADDEIAAFTPSDGAVATSSRLRKQWTVADRHYHHLLDPRTGEPAVTDLVSVSCCAATAWWAEVAAKAVLISGSSEAIGLFNEFGVHGIAVTDSGRLLRTGDRPLLVGGEDHEGAVA
jgi:thiamine biosynthesis lipoprotein